MNDLDRAILALARSQAALPELMRQLSQGELWFLLPYHPELEDGMMELKNGMPLPFSMVENEEGPAVMLFSSQERAEESMGKAGILPKTLVTGAMEARQVLEVLGMMELRAILNTGCKTGELLLPPNMMRDIADGSALEPLGPTGETVEETVNIIDPADYPTGLLQAAFEVLRQHANFRAAWILERGKGVPTETGGRRFQFLLLMDPPDAVVTHDFNLVVQSARGRDEAGFGFLDQGDPAYIASIWRQAAPFYTAPGVEPPPGVSGELSA